jgi:hypothetical protein
LKVPRRQSALPEYQIASGAVLLAHRFAATWRLPAVFVEKQSLRSVNAADPSDRGGRKRAPKASRLRES